MRTIVKEIRDYLNIGQIEFSKQKKSIFRKNNSFLLSYYSL